MKTIYTLLHYAGNLIHRFFLVSFNYIYNGFLYVLLNATVISGQQKLDFALVHY